jgi:hypothetical protein
MSGDDAWDESNTASLLVGRSRTGSIDETVNSVLRSSTGNTTSSLTNGKVLITANYRERTTDSNLGNPLEISTNDLGDNRSDNDESMRYTRAPSQEGISETFSRGSLIGASRMRYDNTSENSNIVGGKDTQSSSELGTTASPLGTTQAIPLVTGPDGKMIYASNTIVASDGEIYHIQPHMLPPPSEIAALFREKRERAQSTTSGSGLTPDRHELAITSIENTPLFKGSYFHQNMMRDQHRSMKRVGDNVGGGDMYSLRDFGSDSHGSDRSRSNTLDAHELENAVAGAFHNGAISKNSPLYSGSSTAVSSTVGSAVPSTYISRTSSQDQVGSAIDGNSSILLPSTFSVHNSIQQQQNVNGSNSNSQNGSASSSTVNSPSHGGASTRRMSTIPRGILPPNINIQSNGRVSSMPNSNDITSSSLLDSNNNGYEKSTSSLLRGNNGATTSGSDDTSNQFETDSVDGRIFDIRNSTSSTPQNADATATTTISSSDISNNNTQARERAEKSSTYFHIGKFKLVSYVMTEMLGVGMPSTGEKQGKDNIQNFLKVPFSLESLIWLGFLVCFDSFIYVFTYLPVRCLYGVYLLIVDCHKVFLPKQLSYIHDALASPIHASQKASRSGSSNSANSGSGADNQSSSSTSAPADGSSFMFQRSNAFDLARGALVFIGVCMLQMLNMSRLYHYIRGQAMIKLYVLTSMLEVLDKLLSSFGQDAFDSLHFQLRSVSLKWSGASTAFLSFFVAAFYVCLHSAIYFIHVATLTVAINSAEQALITVLILNNFAEIKSFVFKKFDRTNLFQLACSDITERFQITLYLSVIVFVALVQAGDEWLEIMPSQLYIMMLMYIGECLCDWIKHAFISKFNHIDASVYEDFSRVLRKDILSYQKDKEKGVDRTYAITRRVGLSQVPLACVTIRYLNLAWTSPQFQYAFSQWSSSMKWSVISLLFLGLLLFKVIFGIAIFFYAGFVHNRELILREQRNAGMPSGIKASASALSNIERYTTHKGHVIG